MKETIGSAKYVVGFLKVIFDFNTNSQPTVSLSKELNFAHGDVTTDENENTEKDNYDNDDLDESAGSHYDSFEEVHFFETPKNISKRKKCRNLAGSSSFEDSLNTSCDNESLAVEMFGADKVLVNDIEEESDDKAVVIDDPDPLIMSYADICKINAPVYETPKVKGKDSSSWRNCRNEVNVSEIAFDNTRDNLEDTAEPLETKVDDEAFSQEFYEFAVKGNDQSKTLPILEVTPSPFFEDLESEVPGTPCLPSSARSSASSRTSDIGEEGFRFRQKEPEVNDHGTPRRAFEEESVSEHSTVAGANSTNIVTPNLKQDLESCVNSTQELKISRKLSMLDQEKFLLEPISPIISVEPKSPNLPVQQISPAPTSSVTGDILHLDSISEEDHNQQQFTVIKDSSPDFRFHKQSLPTPVVGDDRPITPITPVSATNSTFITDQPIPATNSTFNNSLLNYREPLNLDPQTAVQVPVVSTPTVLKTILGKKSHRLAKRVNFTDSSEVFYFPRSQGWVSVPKEGGNTLGMGDIHFHAELVPMMDKENWDSSPNLGNLLTDSYSDNDPSRALRPRKSARLSLSSTAKPKKFLDTEDMSKKSPESETDSKEWKSTLKKPGVIKLTRVSESKSLPIIAENEDHSFIEKSPEPVKTRELGTRGLDRISSRKRKIILKSSGVVHLDPKEAEELKIIRENRGRVGCDCKGPCDPALCACAGGGVQCHQESPGTPCQCREGECGNPAGRYKFDP